MFYVIIMIIIITLILTHIIVLIFQCNTFSFFVSFLHITAQWNALIQCLRSYHGQHQPSVFPLSTPNPILSQTSLDFNANISPTLISSIDLSTWLRVPLMSIFDEWESKSNLIRNHRDSLDLLINKIKGINIDSI
jgi:hypothetical protein